MFQTLHHAQGNALADGRPLRPYRLDPAPGRIRHLRRGLSATSSSGPRPRASASASRAASSTAAAARSRTSWSRSGRPMRTGATTIPADRQDGKPLDPAFRRLGPDRRPTSRPGSTASRRSSPAACRRAHGHRPMAPHVNVWIAARASISGCTRACISPTRRRPTRQTRC